MTTRTTPSSRTSSRMPVLPAAAFVLVWSSGYIAGPYGVKGMEPLSLVAWRFILAHCHEYRRPCFWLDEHGAVAERYLRGQTDEVVCLNSGQWTEVVYACNAECTQDHVLR